MKKIPFIIIAVIIFYSCSSQKEVIKPKEDKKDSVVVAPVVKKKTLALSIERLRTRSNASLRGISVIDSLTAWASGSNGTILRTTDGGDSWVDVKVKGHETRDFRDIEAFDKNTALIMSIEAPAFFFKTTDGGKTWKRKYMNNNPSIFFDGFSFFDRKNGIAISDPIDGKLYLIATKDAGETWKEIPSVNIPPVIKGESAFAASGTSIALIGKDMVWIGTGGGDRARVYKSEDSGSNWRLTDSKLKAGNSSSGIFSVCFKDELNGIVVGGDYKKDKELSANCAVSDDGGLSWQLIEQNQPAGFRSCVAWNEIEKYWLTVGTSGADFSVDDGRTWTPLNKNSYNSIGFSKADGTGFIVGDKGVIYKVRANYFYK
jgi:photosystem II stability/assembly factor-like uncharacterized protein